MEIVCPQCGFSRDVRADRVQGRSVIVTCPKCACRFRLSPDGLTEILPRTQKTQDEEEDIRVIASRAYEREARRFSQEAQGQPESPDLKNPWETAPGEQGWLHAFSQTILRVMLAAPEFFRRLPPQTGWARPFSFFLVVALFQTLVERLWGEFFLGMLGTDADPQMEKMLALIVPEDNLVLALLLRVAALIFQLYVFSFLMFLAYRLMAPKKATFSLLFQIYAYSSAPAILCVIPAIGTLAGAIWGIGCLAVGCKAALGLDWPRTFFGFLPLLLIFAPVLSQLFSLGPQ